MEIHRLKPMKAGYDPKLFEELYYKTEALRKKLVFEIDNRRLGVGKDLVASWFDDKFILAFNKYWDTEPERLLGYIINSLKTFKFRVLRKAYQENLYQNIIRIDNAEIYINIIAEEEDSGKKALLGLALEFMERELSEDAFFLLNLQLTPPPYITKKLSQASKVIPARFILEYLEIPVTQGTQEWIRALREEIEIATLKAKEYFHLVNPELVETK